MKKPAVFLDRDGVILEEADHLRRIEDIHVFPFAAQAIKEIKEKGYLVILISNQAVIARGMISEEGHAKIHEEIIARLRKEGAHIDATYYCPHHPDGSVAEFALQCRCRKPASGMVERAAAEHDVDLAQSFVVGDKTSDIALGPLTGVKTILVKTGYGGKDGICDAVADFEAEDLLDALRFIPFGRN